MKAGFNSLQITCQTLIRDADTLTHYNEPGRAKFQPFETVCNFM